MGSIHLSLTSSALLEIILALGAGKHGKYP